MLNNPRMVSAEYGNVDQILANTNWKAEVSIRVDSTIANGEDGQGRELVLAGTPLTGDLTDRTAVFTLAGAGDPVHGVLINDVPAWQDPVATNGSLLMAGVVNLDRIDDAVVTQIQATDIYADNTSRIIFIRSN